MWSFQTPKATHCNTRENECERDQTMILTYKQRSKSKRQSDSENDRYREGGQIDKVTEKPRPILPGQKAR